MTMKIEVTKNQEVESNHNYITCEMGEFEPNDYVLCKEKTENIDNTVMFLASQVVIKNTIYESSI